MRLRLFVPAALVLTAALFSCKKDSSNPVTPNGGTSSSDFYPLAAGNWWLYDTWDTDSLGAKVPGSDATRKDSVLATVTVNGMNAFQVVSIHNDTLGAVDTIGFDANGDLVMYSDTSGTGHIVAMVALHMSNTDPAKKYETYRPIMVDTLTVIDTSTERYIGIAAVSVTAGSYSARQYKMTSNTSMSMPGGIAFGTTSEQDVFCAAHVGLVKTTATITSSMVYPPYLNSQTTQGSVEVLRSYHVQ